MILLRGALRHADFVHEGLPRNGKNGVGACQTALQAGHPSGVLLLGIGILLHRPLVFEARQGERYRVIGIGLERIGFHRLGEGDDVQVGLDLNADFRPRNARDGSHVHVAVEGGGGQFRRIRPFHGHGGGIGGRREGDGTGGKGTMSNFKKAKMCSKVNLEAELPWGVPTFQSPSSSRVAVE